MDQDKIRQPLTEEETLISNTDPIGSLQPEQADSLLTEIFNISPRLEILEKIGQGGMCAVYKARHLIMNKVVAVKILLPHLISNPMMLRRFQQEAQATVILNHASIIRIYDTDISCKGHAYIVMDYIDGESLHDLLHQEWRLKPEVALDLFVQLAQGLSHAHEHGIIHRDLKPSNVMLICDGSDHFQVKLVDFGIAKIIAQENGQALTQTGDVFGSPLYMSPEQCSGQILDSRSDIYSFGCLMYETLAGQPPFVGVNPLKTMQMHMAQPPAEFVMSNSTETLKKNLQKITFKCLGKSPDDRYQTAVDVLIDLLRSSQEDFGKEERNGKPRIDLKILAAVFFVVVLTIGIGASFIQCLRTIEAPSFYADKPIWNKPIWPLPDATPFDERDQRQLSETLEGLNDQHRMHRDPVEYVGDFRTAADLYFRHGSYGEALTYSCI